MCQKQTNKTLEIITNEVASLLHNDKSGHGMDHINRVLNLSLQFAQQEKANEKLVAMIALLHDVDDHKLVGEKQETMAKSTQTILNKTSLDDASKEIIIKEIQSIGYSNALKGIRPTTIEGKIVSDADMCDALGAHGILRTYTYGQNHHRPFFDKQIFPTDIKKREDYIRSNTTTICHFFEKLLKLKYLMLTKSGRETAEARHQLMIDFLYQYFKEENDEQWITYLTQYLSQLEKANIN